MFTNALCRKIPFQLPMTGTVLVCMNEDRSKFTAHVLDFDLICEGASEVQVMKKLMLAIKSYIDYGMMNGWSDEILQPAPQEYWDLVTSERTRTGLLPPIKFDTSSLVLFCNGPRFFPS